MIRSALTLLAMALSPSLAAAQDAPSRTIHFVEDHCMRPFPGRSAYDLPREWCQPPMAAALETMVNVGIIEEIDCGNFVMSQSGTDLTGTTSRFYMLTVEEFTHGVDDQERYLAKDWQRLYVHTSPGAHLPIAADIRESASSGVYDPMDWTGTNSHLWHPAPGHPLRAEIVARWEPPLGDRLPNPLGQISRHDVVVSADDHKMALQIQVIRPDITFTPGLSDTILHVKVAE